MLKNIAVPPRSALTARAASFAYPLLPDGPTIDACDVAEQWPLEPQRLMDKARRQTGLSDFGAEPMREPLAVLCDSLDHEMMLSAAGRISAHRRLLGILVTRLRLEALWKRRPEILALPVESPWFVVGLPRSGTTLLHRLLARDPALRSAPFWELLNPLPLGDIEGPQPDPDPRIALAEEALSALHRVAPELVQMHEMEAEAPDEELNLLALGFCSMGFEFSFTVPSYVRYYAQQDHTAGYRYFRRVLQTLQWLRGGRHWVLKAPSHMEQLRPLLAVFPDARIIQTHRDAVTATVSLVSLTCYGVRNYFDHPNPLLMGQSLSGAVERLLRGIARDRAADDPRFVDVQFAEMMADPIAMVRKIYTSAGRELSPQTEQAMRAWLATHRRGKHGVHEYSALDFGIDVGERQRALRFYHERFGVPVDVPPRPDANEVRAIAEEAYVYAYPMLMSYGFLYAQAVDTESKMHQGTNRLHHFRQLGGPAFLNIIPWINNDTPYSAGWLDLRAEPFVLSLPSFAAQRFQDVQLIDLYTHNFAFFGTRVNGNDATTILIAGPDWRGDVPAGIGHVARAETRLVKIVTRILLEHPDDGAAIHALEDQYRLERLSQYAGTPAPAAPPAIDFPAPGTPRLEARSAEFIRWLNFLLPLCETPADEAPMFERCAKIGIVAGAPFDPGALDPAQLDAINAGVAAAYARIEAKAAHLDERSNGWEMPLTLRGNRARMACDGAALLRRAAAALYAIWGVDAEEGLYMVADVDARGNALDGAAHRYELRFNGPPPVHAFWSFTVYDAKTRLLVEHPSGRYAVRDRDPGLQRGADGSLTLRLQHESPGAAHEANWLPVPQRPFQVVARLYWPAQELLDGRYQPPGIRMVE
jgi:hypothetical protein